MMCSSEIVSDTFLAMVKQNESLTMSDFLMILNLIFLAIFREYKVTSSSTGSHADAS